MPFVAVAPSTTLDEAIRLANDTEYGLTAGFYSEDRRRDRPFLSSIEAGVVYVNRRAGATTGAWPGVQPFGGWKGSGTSGKAGGGPYYVQQYLREQSPHGDRGVSDGRDAATLAAAEAPALVTELPGPRGPGA